MITKKHIYLKDLHEDHKKWLNEINLYDEDIQSFESHLSELVRKNGSQTLLDVLKKFQKTLTQHKKLADTLRHDITIHGEYLAQIAEKNRLALKEKQLADHPQLRNQIQTERKVFRKLKDDLTRLLAKVM